MSSRHLRRVQQMSSQPTHSQPDSFDQLSDDAAPSNGRSNLFSLLDSAEDACVSDSADLEENSRRRVAGDSDDGTLAPKQEIGACRRNKRKKKRKKAQATTSANTGDPDDIDAVISEIGACSSRADTASGSSGACPSHADTASGYPGAFTDIDDLIRSGSALKIERKYLHAENEMRRLFGRHVLQQPGSRRPARDHVHVAAQSAMVANSQRFAHTPSLGLTMSAPERADSVQLFKYVHGKTYQRVERLFLETVESGDPDNVLSLMNAFPGHVNTVLQLSEVCRLSDDQAMSRQLLERALFLLESAAHPLFSLTSGTARLLYRHHENRVMFLAVFRHILALSDRGCHRTGLEFCKLLLSLQPLDDPLAAVLLLDYLALRAREYTWILQFLEQWEPVRNLLQLPCWAFSVPLARLQLSYDEKSTQKSAMLREQADSGLQQALILFPGVAAPLLDKCGLSEFTLQSCRRPFDTASLSTQSDALSALCCLYVQRAGDLWKSLNAGSWLLQHVQQVVQLVDADPQHAAAVSAAEQRTTRYQCLPLSICRHIICSDIKEARAFLPQEVVGRPVLSHDPLPPADSTCDYQLQLPRRSSSAEASSGPLASFFYSLLPSYDVAANNVSPAIGSGGGAGAPDPGGQQLRQSVQSLLHAMRQLLVTVGPTSEEADGAEQESEEVERETAETGEEAEDGPSEQINDRNQNSSLDRVEDGRDENSSE